MRPQGYHEIEKCCATCRFMDELACTADKSDPAPSIQYNVSSDSPEWEETMDAFDAWRERSKVRVNGTCPSWEARK